MKNLEDYRNCEACFYYEEREYSGYNGFCHRYPPSPILSPESNIWEDSFPLVVKTHWCGEFKEEE